MHRGIQKVRVGQGGEKSAENRVPGQSAPGILGDERGFRSETDGQTGQAVAYWARH